jgi:hypothetical protein
VVAASSVGLNGAFMEGLAGIKIRCHRPRRRTIQYAGTFRIDR